MNLKPLSYSALALVAAFAIGCSPSATPQGGAGENKTTTETEATQSGSQAAGSGAASAAELPPGVDPNGPMLTKPKDGEQPKTAPDGGKTEEQRAQMPGRPGPGGGGGTRGMGLGFLLAMEPVKKELGLTNDQVTKIQAAIPQGMREMSPEDRTKAIEKMQADIKKVLKPEQYKRMQELQYQAMGTRGLTNPQVVKELGLSEDQVKKIEEALNVPRPQATGNQGEQPSEEEITKMREARAKAREAANAKALAVLTPEQKKKWDAMLGKKFEFPQMGGGGGMQRPSQPAGGGRGA